MQFTKMYAKQKITDLLILFHLVSVVVLFSTSF